MYCPSAHTMQSSVSALGFGHPCKQDPLNTSQWLLLHVSWHLWTHPGEYLVLSQPITFISQISIDVYTSLSLPGHADLYPTGLLFVNTICRTSLLIVMFCIGAGHPDIGSWRYIRLFGSGDEILKV